MKLYPVYKKQFNITLLVILLIVFIFLPVFFIYAQTALELQNKINQKDADINKLEEEIKAYQIELENLGKQKNSLSKSLKELDLTRKKLVADINVTQNIIKLKQIKGELEDTRKETVSAKNELVVLKSKLSDQQKVVIQNTNEKNKLLKQTKNSETNYQKL